ncbi:hypothetical protein TH61_05395 [Rufibacter sp. DG15C]|uniref:DUF2911 domain-containing protein n=1 Tax=Rufibacter sp. DG15C TaxID=1379909 RepID=UPI00078C971E|nr:DUF2911 domain-containing protein [Rufibacter sp. DG15C]AMM50726.1 hypothetical protein TH61_05395 [Rufibacter sp. DG15C]
MFSRITSTAGILCLSLVFFSCTQNAEVQQAQEKDTTSFVSSTEEVEDATIIKVQSEPDTVKGSLKAVAKENIAGVNITVRYHSPAVRKRVIWGGLVAYNQVWVTGAHSATTLELDGPIRLGGKEVPAGKYALFTIPGEKEWTVILNRNWEQHLADEYSEAEDMMRLTVKPEQASHQERLRYAIQPAGADKGTLVIHWDRLRIPISIGQ